MFKRKYSKEVYDFIQDNIEMKGLAKAVQNKFGINFGKGTIEYYRRKHRGIKRICPKTIPTFLTKPVGTERIDKDGYIRIIVKEGQEELKHRVVWEKNNRKLNNDECLIFLDGNKLNCELDNLYLFKRKYMGALNNMIRNNKNITPEQRKSFILCSILQIEAKEKEIKLKAKSPRRKPKSNNYILVRELYNQGLLPSQIATKLNKSVNVIHWTLRRLKLGCYDV